MLLARKGVGRSIAAPTFVTQYSWIDTSIAKDIRVADARGDHLNQKLVLSGLASQQLLPFPFMLRVAHDAHAGDGEFGHCASHGVVKALPKQELQECDTIWTEQQRGARHPAEDLLSISGAAIPRKTLCFRGSSTEVAVDRRNRDDEE